MMMGLLIILLTFGLGYGAGFVVRGIVARRRRRAARGEGRPQQRKPVAAAGRDEAINLEGLLVAANDDVSGRRRQRPGAAQPADRHPRTDEFDGAVRDLLGELHRRPEQPSSPRPRAVPVSNARGRSER
ncbi:hypothetical protein XH93_32715 [Bradyrhizobium sp. CCBAU 51753]|nr:hypothetical protein XH93_32715 [Bradyrhizobium sp. CCBAU 51753]